MPRYHRSFIPGYPYHVVQRGHDRQPVFAGPDDYRYYIDNLIEQKQKYDLRLFAYCLMTNHVHLVLQAEGDGADISSCMRVVAARQTRYTNRLERRSGTLWEGRFKASLVDYSAYLLSCCRYVDLNPVRAGMVTTAQAYRWSSYRERAGYASGEPFVDPDPAYESLGAGAEARWIRYREFVASGIPEPELHLIRTALQRNQITGTQRFIEAIAHKLGRRVDARGRGRPRLATQAQSGTFSSVSELEK